ncbi:hypothetical protein ELG89_34560 [Rhizobium leguminosarum]|nr:hypothetical protein ELG89_34560 [Rhizobium leguminosarum]
MLKLTVTGRLVLRISLGKVRVQSVSSTETGFNWRGFKRVRDGSLICQAPMAGWDRLDPLSACSRVVALIIQSHSPPPDAYIIAHSLKGLGFSFRTTLATSVGRPSHLYNASYRVILAL